MKKDMFRCSGHYEPWDGHNLELCQGVETEDKYDLIWMVFWYMGYHACGHRCDQCHGYKDRLRVAWRALKGKPNYAEEFVFEKEEARRLGERLIELAK